MEKGDLVNVDFDGYEAWYRENVPNGIWMSGGYREFAPFKIDKIDDTYARIKFKNPNVDWDNTTAHIPLQFVSKVESE